MDNDLEKLIKMSKEVAKPWKVTTFLLSFLLCLSILGNIYLFQKKTIIKFSANENSQSMITQTK